MIAHSFHHYYKLIRGCYECRRVAIDRHKRNVTSTQKLHEELMKYNTLERYIFERAKRELE